MIAAHDIGLQRHGRAVLQAVNLVARPGRVLALVGPNGAGKSSLLGVLSGQLRATVGVASLDGVPLADWAPRVLAQRRAMLSQRVQLGFAFSVDEVVMLGRSPHGGRHDDRRDRRVVESALRAAHAWALRGRSYLALSGGEQQRVQLARVLAQVWEPGSGASWLLLDEPEAGLDIAHQHFMLRRARGLAADGFGVIVVLHELNLAARYADDVAVLAAGRLRRLGPPEEALDAALLSEVYDMPLVRRRFSSGTDWAIVPS
jgi:iron complex transport system ATP-binding protein